MILGKSIRVYLQEGSVAGIKLAEVVNLTIQALSSPRVKISDLNNHFKYQINTQGVYFLIGTDEKTAKPKVYIGEGENVWERLKNHAVTKDFWNEVICFTSKDDNITKSHVKYLESRLIDICKNAGRILLDNTNYPSLNSLPLPDRDAMEEFIFNIKLLSGTLGHKFLEDPIGFTAFKDQTNHTIEPSQAESTDVKKELELNLYIKGVVATAIQTDEGIVVLPGSQVIEKESKNYGYKTLRDELILDNIIQRDQKGSLFFAKKHLFSSPSSAAAVIAGYSINGRKMWKDQNGRSLNDIEKNEIIKERFENS